MPRSHTLCCLPVKKQKYNFFFVQCLIKQLLDSDFVISRILKVSVRVINRSQRLRPITLIILDQITKTSSNIFFYNLTTYRLAEHKQFIATNFFCIDNVIQTCIQHKFNLLIMRPTFLLRHSRSTLALHKFLTVILC